MRRDFSHKKNSFKDTADRSAWRRVLVAAVVLVAIGGGWFVYQTPTVHASVSTTATRCVAWIKARKNNFHAGIATVKQFASDQPEAEPDIHFEFYNTLPNMHLNVAEIAKNEKSNQRVTPASKSTIITADDLARDLSSEIQKHQSK